MNMFNFFKRKQKPIKYHDYGIDWFITYNNGIFKLYHELKYYKNDSRSCDILIKHTLIYIGEFTSITDIYNYIMISRLGHHSIDTYAQPKYLSYCDLKDRTGIKYNNDNNDFEIGTFVSYKIWTNIPYNINLKYFEYDWQCDFLKHPEYLEYGKQHWVSESSCHLTLAELCHFLCRELNLKYDV